jgi:glycosyltransferase involved in cell wall biosynthesis
VRIANRIIADAQEIKQILSSRHRHVQPCSVIPYGAYVIEDIPDTAIIQEWNLYPYKYYLIVCRLEPENHVLEILNGFASSKSTCYLIVVGDDRADTAYVQQLRAVNDKRIHFIGTVYNQDNLRSLRYYCRAYFHGHSVGGTNPSLLEALGSGNIVIAHDNLFNREVAGDLGLYFKTAGEIPSLLTEVENMDRGDMSAKARHLVMSRYNWEVITDMYERILMNHE